MTPKGARTSREILDAALRCVARDGVPSLSMQRIADEAGCGKRAVVYYYATREGLLAAVIRHVGDRMLGQLEEAVRDIDEPAEVVERGFDAVWQTITTDRALLAAWFGLHAEAVTNPTFRESASYISERLEHIVGGLIDVQLARGRVLRVDRSALLVLVVANVQGLTTYYLEHGDTPALQAAIGEFRAFLTSVTQPPRRTAKRSGRTTAAR
jgi:AcrR family transcriptional regulator